MAGCCGPKCSKAFVIFFNIIFWFSGCAMVALGVVLLYDQSYSSYFTLLTTAALPQEIVQYTAFACIGLGGFILFVGFFGCCGALQDSKCMLGTYVFCLLLVFLVEAAAALFCLYFRFYFPSEVRQNLKLKLDNDYGMEMQEVFTESLDFTQYELECCGIEGYGDYIHSKWVNKTIAQKGFQRVPVTCCVQDKSQEWLQEYPWKEPKPKDPARCQASDPAEFNESLNAQGCWSKLNSWYSLHNLILAATSGGLALLQILGVAFTICLFRNIGEEA
ncbi:Tetraspanin-11 [Orchesella cincta]|uniref:Tetraspanin n=1 Tax=Orchesella cincta TaxID=48709 RepID=A0A1D2N9W9_ORCCI|nr:Tetraspanin-11 [Orchesella cincta]